MLETLTKAQEKLMIKVRDRYLNYFFDNKPKKYDKKKVEKGIAMMYKLCGYEKPEIIYLYSPLGCQYFANLIKNTQVDKELKNVGDNVRDNVGANVRDNVRANVGDNVRANVRDNVRANVGDNVRANVGANVGDNVRANVGDNVGANVRDNVRANVRDNVRANVGDNVRANVGDKMEFYTFSDYGNCRDLGRLAFYEYFDSIGIDLGKSKDNFNVFKDMILNGVYDMIQFEKVCIVSMNPIKIERDERGRMHNENGFAIEFKDGYVLNYLQGVNIPYEMYDKIVNDKMTPQEIFKIENTELRRIAYEYMDKAKMKKLKDYKILDNAKDGYGNKMQIIEFKVEGFKEAFRYYQCVCPSSNREYFLETKEDKCEKAKSKSFGLEKTQWDVEA